MRIHTVLVGLLAVAAMPADAQQTQLQIRQAEPSEGRGTAGGDSAVGGTLAIQPQGPVGLNCKTPWGTCYYKEGSGIANCYPSGGTNWLTANCDNAGGTDTVDKNGKRVCSGMQNPC